MPRRPHVEEWQEPWMGWRGVKLGVPWSGGSCRVPGSRTSMLPASQIHMGTRPVGRPGSRQGAWSWWSPKDPPTQLLGPPLWGWRGSQGPTCHPSWGQAVTTGEGGALTWFQFFSKRRKCNGRMERKKTKVTRNHRNRSRERRSFGKKRGKEGAWWHREAPEPPAEGGAEALGWGLWGTAGSAEEGLGPGVPWDVIFNSNLTGTAVKNSRNSVFPYICLPIIVIGKLPWLKAKICLKSWKFHKGRNNFQD